MHRHRLTWVGILSIIVLMFLRLPPMVAKEDSVLNTYRALVEVDALAKQHYVERIADDRLVDGAIRGMMLQLDPYSGYIAPDELGQFRRRLAGEYIGVGIEVGMRDGRPTIIAAIEGGPAAKAGVLAGDRIITIDGSAVEELSVFDMERLLEGKPNTTLRLTAVPIGSGEPKDLRITRGPVSITTVRGFRRDEFNRWDYLIDPTSRIGYVRVSNFQKNTMRAFDAALKELVGQGMRGLIIDLRFNPGGIVDQAVAMVDRFVDYGIIVSTVTRRRAVEKHFANVHGTLSDIELAVLINGGTASAAEIVSGSLQDRGRALVLGERSFGKGSVQNIMNLTTHDAAVRVTVAYYRLPGGGLIHRTPRNRHTDSWGVKPDVEVLLTDDEVNAIQRSRRTLDTGGGGANYELPITNDEIDVANRHGHLEIEHDRQLAEALTHMRDRLANR